MEQPDNKKILHTETHIWGEQTSIRCVGSQEKAERSWLEGQPVCESLANYQILHAGILQARHPYEIVRLNQGGAFFLDTLRGKGRILVDGSWHTCEKGQACLLPAYKTNAIHCIEGEEWDFCWVRYRHPQGQIPLIAASEPVIAEFSTEQFHAAILGMLYEAEHEQRPTITEQWARLIHLYVKEFVAPYQSDERLWSLWHTVEHNLAVDWTLDNLAKKACLSGEHVRRLCKSQHGKSPMQQVRWMRMQRAAELLLITDYKIESIAYDVGYKNSTVFSSAFKKQFGMNPSEYRIKQTASPK